MFPFPYFLTRFRTGGDAAPSAAAHVGSGRALYCELHIIPNVINRRF
jgi:hypothetical protein